MPKLLNLQLQYDKRHSDALLKLIKKEYPKLKYTTVRNQLGRLIFTLKFKSVDDSYRFGWNWGEKYNKKFKNKRAS